MPQPDRQSEPQSERQSPLAPMHRPSVLSSTLRQRRLVAVDAVGSVDTGSTVGGSTVGSLGLLPVESTVHVGLPRVGQPSIARWQLLARMNEWAPVTVLAGLRGTGKTTLVTSWLASLSPFEVTSLWLGGGTEVADEVELELALVLDCAGIGRSAATSIARLHNALIARPGNHKIVLVLDGVTPGIDEPDRRALIALTQRHRNFHLVVCAGTGDPVSALAAASGPVNTITTRELLFTRDEVIELARVASLGVDNFDPASAASLQALTGGWPALVRLILAASTRDGRSVPSDVVRRYVLDAVRTDTDGADGAADYLGRFALAEHLDTSMI